MPVLASGQHQRLLLGPLDMHPHATSIRRKSVTLSGAQDTTSAIFFRRSGSASWLRIGTQNRPPGGCSNSETRVSMTGISRGRLEAISLLAATGPTP